MKKLKAKWGIQSNLQLIVIFVVFAVTGSSSVYVSTPIFDFFGISKDSLNIFLFYILKIIIVFPVYLVLLLFFGFISGQIKFFWKFEKNMLINMGFGFLFK
jgi:manganese efflux pump family protein